MFKSGRRSPSQIEENLMSFAPLAHSSRRSARSTQSSSSSVPSLDIRLIADLLASQDGYAAYAGIGSRETPVDVCDDMTRIAAALEARGFTLRSGFAKGADTAFELGTVRDDRREIYAPWRGFGANPQSRWDKPRFDQIARHEAKSDRQFVPASALVLEGEVFARAQQLASQHHAAWDRLPQSARKLHSRNMGQVLGARLDAPARFLIAWTSDGQDTGGTGQAIRVARSLGIPVLNLHSAQVRAEILRVLGLTAGAATPATEAPVAASLSSDHASEGRVTYRSGDVTTDDADLLVNTVNCVGVMGKGVALAFKNRWPSIMPEYQASCRSKALRPGGCQLYPLPDRRLWAGLATKDHWRAPSQLAWVRDGLRVLAEQARAAGVRSIAIPPPGCGNGGLSWAEVEPLVLEALEGFDLRIYAAPSNGGR